jgi:hypothetical protein
MARAPKKLTQKTKVVKPRISRAARVSLDDKYYGPEPIDISKKGFTDALNWYNYMFEQEETRDWLFEYLKKNEYAKSDIAAIRKLPKYKVTKTACSVARILLNGNVLPEKNLVYFRNTIQSLIEAGNLIKEEVKDESAEKVVSIQERTQAKIQALLTECEEAVDNDSQLNIYEWLKGKEATSQAATAICDYYSKWIKDFEYEDEHETRSEKKARLERLKYWQQFVYDCERYVGNKKVAKVRKPREKKQKSAVDLVKSLKYQKEFPQLKIVSVNPAEVIGSQQLWTYNTKYKKLTRYDAVGPSGIQVKGTTLIGFDIDKSITKSIRKPEIAIQQLLVAGKVSLRKFMDDIKTNETKPNGRINSDTVLLRVIK